MEWTRRPVPARWAAPALVVAAAFGAVPGGGVIAPAAAGAARIVVLRPGVALEPVLGRLGLLADGSPTVPTYHHVFTGFAARLSPATEAWLTADPGVAAVVADGKHRAAALDAFAQDGQIVDNAVRRVGALQSPTAAIDGYDTGVNADIAVVDSGLPPANPDLNVVGGVDCTGSGSWNDTTGHGTFVGGLAAARDDGRGVVGVAPGARLWAVKVMGADETVTDAAYLCGLDWVAEHTSTIDVVNISLGGPGVDTDCGANDPSALGLEHAAICRIVAGGTVAVAAAGNSGVDAGDSNPAGFPEVITVSAITDTDGASGGSGPPSGCYPGADDTLAAYSDFGAVVDIAAPGTCIESTWLGDQYAVASGTSAAAPLVAGGAALIKAVHPDWPPDQVRQLLLSTAEPGPVAGDSDGFSEPILDVTGY